MVRDRVFGVLARASKLATAAAVVAFVVISLHADHVIKLSIAMRAVLIIIFADGLLLVVANTFRDDIFPAKVDVHAWNEFVVKFMVLSLFASILTCLALLPAGHARFDG